MPKQTTSYKDWLGAKLADPSRAARFLNAAQADSPAAFLKALRKVATAQVRSMVDIAETVGVSRESLYRMMSESGNPSHFNIKGIIEAMGFEFQIVQRKTTYATPDDIGHQKKDVDTFTKAQDLAESTKHGLELAKQFRQWRFSGVVNSIGNPHGVSMRFRSPIPTSTSSLLVCANPAAFAADEIRPSSMTILYSSLGSNSTEVGYYNG